MYGENEVIFWRCTFGVLAMIGMIVASLTATGVFHSRRGDDGGEVRR